MSGWRKARPLPESVSTPVARASSSAGTRSATVLPSTAVRSVIANSTPSSAAARSTSLVDAETNPSRSAIAPGSESGTVSGRELRGAGGRDRDAARPGERGQHLGEVERIARRAGREPQQPGVRPAAGQRPDELGHGRLGERAELDAMCVVHRAAQREEVLPLRYRAGHADEQQRHLVARSWRAVPRA